jgi:hypothetical protein
MVSPSKIGTLSKTLSAVGNGVVHPDVMRSTHFDSLVCRIVKRAAILGRSINTEVASWSSKRHKRISSRIWENQSKVDTAD